MPVTECLLYHCIVNQNFQIKFQKHKRSPRIKTALSQTALESVKSGGAAKKIRTTASARKLHDENVFIGRGSMSTSTLMNLDTSNHVVISSLGSSNRLRRKSNPSPALSRAKTHPPAIIVRKNSEETILEAAATSMKSAESSSLRRQTASSGSLAAAAVGKRILKQQLKTQYLTTGECKSAGAFR